MTETLSSCPVCNGTALLKDKTCKDFVASGELFNLMRCTSCGLVFTNPRPDLNHIGRYYQTNNYVSHANSKKGFIYLIYDLIRGISQRNKLAQINNRLPKGKLLDVGCGLGYFLFAAKNNGWSVEGLDVSEEARNYVKTTFSIDVNREEAIKSFDAASFDAITLWHVLEHFHNLHEWVEDMKRVLRPDGRMFVAVPNCSSYDAAFYKEFWDGFDVPRHLYHFNHHSIDTLFTRHGMVVEERLPMIFDSYYISWRSEIHKRTFLGFIRAMVVGQLSNWKARKEKNYSSVLYIIKHAKEI